MIIFQIIITVGLALCFLCGNIMLYISVSNLIHAFKDYRKSVKEERDLYG